MLIGRQLTDSRLILCAILAAFSGQPAAKKIITDQFFFDWPTGLDKRSGVDRPSVDYRPIKGWHSASYFQNESLKPD